MRCRAWDDMDGIGNPVSSYYYPHQPEPKEVQTSDEFNSKKLGLQWQWVANPKDNWYELKDGKLLLPAIYSANDPLFETPHVLTQMFPDFSFTATAKMELSNSEKVRGGLTSFGRKTFDIGVEQLDKAFRISVRFNNDILVSALTHERDNIWLRLKTNGEMPKLLERRESASIETEVIQRENLQPYEYEDLERWKNGLITGQFSYSLDGENFTDLGEPFEVRSGRWTGARIGLYSLKNEAEGNGHVAFDYIRIER